MEAASLHDDKINRENGGGGRATNSQGGVKGPVSSVCQFNVYDPEQLWAVATVCHAVAASAEK